MIQRSPPPVDAGSREVGDREVLAAPPKAEPGLFRRATQLVDNAQETTSRRFSNFVVGIDDFFGNEATADIDQESWARLRIDGIKEVGENFTPRATVKLKLKLPQAEERLRLLVSTEDESLEEQAATQRAALDDGSSERSTSVALRFARGLRESTQVNLDVGARYRDDAVQIFGRINSTFEPQVDYGWRWKVWNDYILYSKSGFRNRLGFDTRRSIVGHERYYVRQSLVSSWQKGQSGARIGSTSGLYLNLSESKALAFEFLAGLHTHVSAADGENYRGHALRLRYRATVWRDWFWYEIWPGLAWSAETDYRQEVTGLLRVEMLFGEY